MRKIGIFNRQLLMNQENAIMFRREFIRIVFEAYASIYVYIHLVCYKCRKLDVVKR